MKPFAFAKYMQNKTLCFCKYCGTWDELNLPTDIHCVSSLNTQNETVCKPLQDMRTDSVRITKDTPENCAYFSKYVQKITLRLNISANLNLYAKQILVE
jgi:hypothetical protein